MFKNAHLYRIAGTLPDLAAIEERLAASRFVECGPTQRESAGWVPPRGDDHGALVESIGGQIIVALRSESKAVPGDVVKKHLQARLDQAEKDTGRRPRGKRSKELKEEVVLALLPRAFAKQADTLAWIDMKAGTVLVGASSLSKADAVCTRLLEALGGSLQLSLLNTNLSPGTAMAGWLVNQEAPPGFTIDRDCELKQPDSEKAHVRYGRHTLEIVEVAEHIRQGKLPTQLALTFNGRVSFVLTEAFALKRIKLLDVVLTKPSQDSAPKEDEGGFDADVAITTGELRLLISALVDALGGEVAQTAEPAVQQTAASPLPHSEADGPDPLYLQAVTVVLENRRASISLVQRHLRVGYNRAARLLERMEGDRFVSAMDPSGNRDVLTPREQAQAASA